MSAATIEILMLAILYPVLWFGRAWIQGRRRPRRVYELAPRAGEHQWAKCPSR